MVHVIQNCILPFETKKTKPFLLCPQMPKHKPCSWDHHFLHPRTPCHSVPLRASLVAAVVAHHPKNSRHVWSVRPRCQNFKFNPCRSTWRNYMGVFQSHWGSPKIDGLFHGKSIYGWLRGTLILGKSPYWNWTFYMLIFDNLCSWTSMEIIDPKTEQKTAAVPHGMTGIIQCFSRQKAMLFFTYST